MVDDDLDAGHGRFFIFNVDSENGRQDLVSLLSPEDAFEGGLPPEAIVGVLRQAIEDGGEVTPSNFVANQKFIDFLHVFIAQSVPMNPAVQEQAAESDGYIYIIDHRTPSPEGEVPNEDIIGAFKIVDGRISGKSYEPMGTHLLLTDNGFFVLDDMSMDMLTDMLVRLCQSA